MPRRWRSWRPHSPHYPERAMPAMNSDMVNPMPPSAPAAAQLTPGVCLWLGGDTGAHCQPCAQHEPHRLAKDQAQRDRGPSTAHALQTHPATRRRRRSPGRRPAVPHSSTTARRIAGVCRRAIRSGHGSHPALASPAPTGRPASPPRRAGPPGGSPSPPAPAARLDSPAGAWGSARRGSRRPAWHATRPREGRTRGRCHRPRTAAHRRCRSG